MNETIEVRSKHNCILRLPAVKARTALGRSTIYVLMAEGKFPQVIPLGGGGAVGWLEAEIEAWIQERAKTRNTAPRRGNPRLHEKKVAA